MATLKNGATYRLANRADGNRSLNVYGTAPKSLANVCLYRSSNSDICQKWVYREVGGHKYFVCKGNTGLALDLLTDSSAGSNVSNYNAHVYAPSDTSYVTILGASDGNSRYIRIRLASNSSKYLTANQGSNGTAAGKDVNAAGNVYWYKGGLTDFSQDWEPILLEDVSQPDPPSPGSEQYLCLPFNNTTVNVGYKNFAPGYNLNGTPATHYGVDFIGGTFANDKRFCASGNGIVLGINQIYQANSRYTVGKWVIVKYTNVKGYGDLIVRYFHMHSISVSVGDSVNRDTVLGVMGETGDYCFGRHLHVEVDTDTSSWQYTPTLTGATACGLQPGSRGSGDTTINPLDVFRRKTSAPENQTFSVENDGKWCAGITEPKTFS